MGAKLSFIVAWSEGLVRAVSDRLVDATDVWNHAGSGNDGGARFWLV